MIKLTAEQRQERQHAKNKRDWAKNKKKRQEQHAAWLARNPDYYSRYRNQEVRREDIKRGYNAACAICGQTAQMVIDHDHLTGKFRGLLCRRCNIMLGHGRDNSWILLAGVLYLNRHNDH
jgi:hypothetical protein